MMARLKQRGIDRQKDLFPRVEAELQKMIAADEYPSFTELERRLDLEEGVLSMGNRRWAQPIRERIARVQGQQLRKGVRPGKGGHISPQIKALRQSYIPVAEQVEVIQRMDETLFFWRGEKGRYKLVELAKPEAWHRCYSTGKALPEYQVSLKTQLGQPWQHVFYLSEEGLWKLKRWLRERGAIAAA